MRSATSSEGPRLVRIAVPRAQTRVTIETHSRTNGFERPVQQATEPRAKRETRSVLLQSGGRFDVRAEQESHHAAVVGSSSCS